MKGQALSSVWSDEEKVEKLKLLWPQGFSAGQIAKMIGGVSRNAVIGKAHRLGIAERHTASSPMANMAYRPGDTRRGVNAARAEKRDLRKHNPKPKCAAPPLARQFGTNGAPLSGCKPPAPIVEPAIPAEVVRLPEPTATSCRWPLGDPQGAGFGFCAHEKQTGSPYCVEHTRKAYVSPPKTDKQRSQPSRTRVHKHAIMRCT